MISQKSNPFDTKVRLEESLDLNKFDKHICEHNNSAHFPAVILQYIFSSRSVVMPVGNAEDIIVWLGDSNYSLSVKKLTNYWRVQGKRIHVIQSVNGESENGNDVSLYYLKKGTEGALAMGYLNYFLNTKKRVPEAVSVNETSFIPFSESLKRYDTAFVENETGLCEKDIKKLYRAMEESGQVYHWLAFSTEFNEITAEAVRAICLIAAVHLDEEEIPRIPVSYEQDPEKKAFAVFPEGDNASYTLISQQELAISGKCTSFSEEPSAFERNSEKITFYNWEFADRFDMDPFPSYTSKIVTDKEN